MHNDLKDRVDKIIDRLRGSSDDIIHAFDNAVEDGEISIEEWRQNESEILAYVDDQIFTCTSCGWTLNVDEMGEDTENGELCCENCQ